MNEYLMIPNECVVCAQESEPCCKGFEPAVTLPDLVSHVFAMNVLHVVDPFALR